MSESNWAGLRRHFLASYKELGKWLTRRFGSADLAADVLHDTYLRLERGGELGPVNNPSAYLQRMAENIGRNSRRRASRQLTSVETEVFFEQLMDETPDVASIVAAEQEVAIARAVLETMPPRRRRIFLAAWVEGIPQADIARSLGLTLRRVQKESQKAREQVRQALRARREVTSREETPREESDESPRRGRVARPRVSSQ
jgi:RNA polymerase sigma-70 factor (ECF subfamily)